MDICKDVSSANPSELPEFAEVVHLFILRTSISCVLKDAAEQLPPKAT